MFIEGAFAIGFALRKMEEGIDLHLGKGANVPWAILSVLGRQSASNILNY